MKRAVYARVSGDLQAKEGTIESQVLALKKQIAVAGHALVREYIDDGTIVRTSFALIIGLTESQRLQPRFSRSLHGLAVEREIETLANSRESGRITWREILWRAWGMRQTLVCYWHRTKTGKLMLKVLGESWLASEERACEH
jgi:hypothetical protein